MKLSLRTVMAKAVEAYPKEARKVWVLNWPGQVVLAASIVHWTTEVTQVSNLYKPTNSQDYVVETFRPHLAYIYPVKL